MGDRVDKERWETSFRADGFRGDWWLQGPVRALGMLGVLIWLAWFVSRARRDRAGTVGRLEISALFVVALTPFFFVMMGEPLAIIPFGFLAVVLFVRLRARGDDSRLGLLVRRLAWRARAGIGDGKRLVGRARAPIGVTWFRIEIVSPGGWWSHVRHVTALHAADVPVELLSGETIVLHPMGEFLGGARKGRWQPIPVGEIPPHLRERLDGEPSQAWLRTDVIPLDGRVEIVGRDADPIVAGGDRAYRDQRKTQTFDVLALWRLAGT